MRIKWILATAVFVAIVPATAALSDTIQVLGHFTVSAAITSYDDDFEGTYSNLDPGPPQYSDPEIYGGVSVSSISISFSAPAGDVITSASALVIVPQSSILGTGYIFTAGRFGSEGDPSLPSVAPTFSTTGTSETRVYEYLASGGSSFTDSEAFANIQNLELFLTGTIDSDLLGPGSNWAGYLAGSGEVDIPYTS
jgi:hypothetical protein